MTVPTTTRVAGNVVLTLACTALLTVLAGVATRNPTKPPPEDEGSLAHIFQLSVVLLLPAFVLLVATTDWKQPMRSARILALTSIILTFAFCLLFYFEL